jgi:co-chaperonin GroES (HSP10)
MIRNGDLFTGDIVLFGKHGGQDIEIEGKNYVMIRENELFAVIGHENR